MAPSRGHHSATPATPSTPTLPHPDDHALTQQDSSALKNARRNFSYLLNPASAGAAGIQPRLRTRALLRTIRYISTFIFWRVVRYAKYAAVAGLVGAIGATAFGSVVTGVAWIAAPPTIMASVLASVVWGAGGVIARRLNKRWKKRGGDEGTVVREDVEDGRGVRGTVRSEGSYGLDVGPQAVPW